MEKEGAVGASISIFWLDYEIVYIYSCKIWLKIFVYACETKKTDKFTKLRI
jgi:hypothetical protein